MFFFFSFCCSKKYVSKRRVYFRFRFSTVHSQINVLIRAEVLRDWNAVEVLAHFAVVNGSDVEEKEETDEQKDDA